MKKRPAGSTGRAFCLAVTLYGNNHHWWPAKTGHQVCGLRCADHLAQHIVQDAAVAIVLQLVGSIDAA